MRLRDLLKIRLFGMAYEPRTDEKPFLDRLEVQQSDELSVGLAVLDSGESERFFGVPLARRGIQPIWVQIANRSPSAYRLRLASLDPNYYPPLEAAYVSHFGIGRRLIGFGLFAWVFLIFLPLLIVLPFKLIGVKRANRRMDDVFEKHGIGWGLIKPGADLAGFVFTTLDEGTKQVTVRLLSAAGEKRFLFSILVPGLRVDHRERCFDTMLATMTPIECDVAELRRRLEAMPRSTTNHSGTREGDPLNLAAIGDFATILTGFGARWDETEAISLQSCWRTCKAFLFGSNYRYSPVSSLYVDGRSQDFALQRARRTINERLHLRLWLTALRLQGKPVWIGQISRDIGVRFTHRTWNLTTHKIDPNVDDARDYVIDDLMSSGHVSHVALVGGAEMAEPDAPRHNLTGDPYFTDGMRAVAVFSDSRVEPISLNWT